jgi:membrane-associated protein
VEVVAEILDLILHLNKHLATLVSQYGAWTYAILFAIIFAETGLVVTPFLPGDSLLFAAGAIAGDPAMQINVWWLCVLLTVAAIAGDTVNYHCGYYFGKTVFSNPKSFWLNPEHLQRTQEFFTQYGGKTIVLARFLPIVRTFAPFVAGMGRMNYTNFLFYNVAGGIVWVFSIVLLGYFVGRVKWVQDNFTIVILLIIIISVLPGVFEYWRHWSVQRERSKLKTAEETGKE